MSGSKQDSESEDTTKKVQLNSAPELDATEGQPAVDGTTDDSTSTVSADDSGDDSDDKTTDVVVDDIMKQDSDEVLKKQDEATKQGIIVSPTTRFGRFKNAIAEWWARPRNRYIVLGIFVALLAAIYFVPIARSNVAGLVVKAPVTVQVLDSKTSKAVSGATVSLAGKSAQTDATGKAKLQVNAGSKTLKVTKKYYGGVTKSELVKVWAGTNSFKASLVPLGRQVSVLVVNKITGKPVSGATVKAGSADAKTDKNGKATLVISSDATTQAATVSLANYNDLKVTVTAGGTAAQNTFSVTPAGKLYFLSNLSGKIDVVKTNLDGTDRQTVLAGTGSEDRYSTSLLASRDWKYLALLSKRSGATASVYLIDTTNGDKLTTIDQGDANFSLVGWSGDRFVYQVTRNTVQNWQPNKQALKSFDPANGQSTLLDQTTAAGSGDYDFIGNSFGSPYLMGSQVVYLKNWSSSYTLRTQISSKQVELNAINADGSGHKILKTFSEDPAGLTSYLSASAQLYEPDGLYIDFQNGVKDVFYQYEAGKVTEATDVTADTFYNTSYPTYLISPSGNSTFWGDQRDGKTTLSTGDDDAKNSKQIAALSDYKTYGWFTDDYLLVSKNSSELYVMGAVGGTPLKVTDYYKPAINYNGYGGGYGGL
jgi:hypothetical protein